MPNIDPGLRRKPKDPVVPKPKPDKCTRIHTDRTGMAGTGIVSGAGAAGGVGRGYSTFGSEEGPARGSGYPGGETRKYTIKVDGIVGPQTGSEISAAYNSAFGSSRRNKPGLWSADDRPKMDWTKTSGAGEPTRELYPTHIYKQKGGKIFSPGSNSSGVMEIQNALKALGFYKGKVDGSYGPMTYTAVKNFQKTHNSSILRQSRSTNSIVKVLPGVRGQNTAYGDW